MFWLREEVIFRLEWGPAFPSWGLEVDPAPVNVVILRRKWLKIDNRANRQRVSPIEWLASPLSYLKPKAESRIQI
jgi:hypothetical protein